MINEAIISIETKSFNNYIYLWVKGLFHNSEVKFIGCENKNVDNSFIKSSYKIIFNNSVDHRELEIVCKSISATIEKTFSYNIV